MKTQFTPGPWQAVLDPCPTTRNRWLVEKRKSGWKTFVAEVYGDPDHPGGPDWQGTREANARLIAAAPAMLEALRTLLNECASRFDYLEATPKEFEAMEAARAAIAQATEEVGRD